MTTRTSLKTAVFLALTLPAWATSPQGSPTQAIEARLKTYTKLGEHLFDGPNCFHATAYLMKWTDRLTYMSSEEFLELSKRANCRELAAGENPGPGDLGLLYRPEGGVTEVAHAFLWKDYPEKIYSKTSSFNSFPLAEASIGELSKWFGLKPDCVGEAQPAGTRCEVYLKAFRCGAAPSLTISAPSELKKLEDYVSSLVIGSRVAEDSDLDRLDAQLKKMEAKFTKEEQTIDRLRVDSLRKQIRVIKDPD